MGRNNMFKYATKELSQDAFLCWLVNYINTDEIEYKNIGKEFIKLIVEKIGDKRFKDFIENNNYKVEIKHQYKNIDVLLRIDKFNIIIEDKIKTTEHDNQISEYTYKLISEGIEEKNIFTCYYKIYDEYKFKDKFVNCLITRKDMIEFLEKFDNKNLYMKDYYEYLKEMDKCSKIRNVIVKEMSNLKSESVKNPEEVIYTSFYSELEEKEKSNNIIGWGYADNRNGGVWWYASKMFDNVVNEDFNRVYAEINLKENRNYFVLKLGKKNKDVILKEGEKLQYKLSDEYKENGKVKYFDKEKYFVKNIENNKIEEEYYCRCYKILKNKFSIYNQVITDELLKELEKFDIYTDKNRGRGYIKEDTNKIFKYYTRVGSINVNNYTLEEIEKILVVINKYLEKLKLEF